LVLGPVLVHAALGSHPPLPTAQELMPVHVWPSPVYPTLHAHVLVPGPVWVQVALESQPPFSVVHGLTEVQTAPLPE
jgi:hypothetical protein